MIGFKKEGPTLLLRPLLPNLPSCGVLNAFVSKNRDGVGFEIFGLWIRSGRFTMGLPVPATSSPRTAEIGVPDWRVPIACACHPLINRRDGRLYVVEKTMRCFIWKSESPRSARRL